MKAQYNLAAHGANLAFFKGMGKWFFIAALILFQSQYGIARPQEDIPEPDMSADVQVETGQYVEFEDPAPPAAAAPATAEAVAEAPAPEIASEEKTEKLSDLEVKRPSRKHLSDLQKAKNASTSLKSKLNAINQTIVTEDANLRAERQEIAAQTKQIAKLQQQLSKKKKKLGKIKSQVASAQTKNRQLHAQIHRLNRQIASQN